LHQQREEMLKAVEDAFADGVLTDEEAKQLEEERIRLHLTEEQFERLKQRAMLKHAHQVTAAQSIAEISDKLADLRRTLDTLPAGVAIEEIRKLPVSEQEKAALIVLLK
jgi:hypothetical protein